MVERIAGSHFTQEDEDTLFQVTGFTYDQIGDELSVMCDVKAEYETYILQNENLIG